MTIRMIHFADLHLGAGQNHGKTDPDSGLPGRVIDCKARLAEIVDYALENDAHVAVFSGDAFHTKTPTPTLLKIFADQVGRLTMRGIPVVMVPGNHDLPVSPDRSSSLGIYNSVGILGVHVCDHAESFILETRGGKALRVTTYPYPTRQRVLGAEAGEVSMDDMGNVMLENIKDGLDWMTGRTVVPASDGLPHVLVAHLSVAEAAYGGEREIMVGNDVNIPASYLTALPVDYVALGHIHKHQAWGRESYSAAQAVYPGSPMRVSFNEEDEPKGFVWVEIDEEGGAVWKFIKLNARPYITLQADITDVDDEDIKAKLETDLHNDDRGWDDAIVRVVIKMLEEQRPFLMDSDIQALLESAYHIAGISRDVGEHRVARLGDIDVTQMTDMDLLKAYCELKGITFDTVKDVAEQLLRSAQDDK